jgi:hypothetical protein
MPVKSLYVRTRYVRTAQLRRNRWHERLTAYLKKAESKAPTLDEKDVCNFCCRLVVLAFEGWSDPYVAAFYYHYGRHPNKLIPEWLWRAEKNRRLNIPDYDPLSDPLCKVRNFPSRPGPMYQMPVSSWPDKQDSLRNSQEEERDGDAQISRTGAADLARTHAAFLDWQRRYQKERYWQRRLTTMCTQCRNPVCAESLCLCALHLQRAREISLASYVRKRLAMGKTVQHGKGWQNRRAEPPLIGLA